MSLPDYPAMAKEAIERATKEKSDLAKLFDKVGGSPMVMDEIAARDPQKAPVSVQLGPWRAWLKSCESSAGCKRTHRDLCKGASIGLADSATVVVQASCILKAQAKAAKK